MSLQHLRHASWLHNALRALVLCFALGTLAYAGHTHELSSHSDTHFSCDYCTSFGGLMDAPDAAAAITSDTFTAESITAPHDRIITTRPVSATQARAPPAC